MQLFPYDSIPGFVLAETPIKGALYLLRHSPCYKDKHNLPLRCRLGQQHSSCLCMENECLGSTEEAVLLAARLRSNFGIMLFGCYVQAKFKVWQ